MCVYVCVSKGGLLLVVVVVVVVVVVMVGLCGCVCVCESCTFYSYLVGRKHLLRVAHLACRGGLSRSQQREERKGLCMYVYECIVRWMKIYIWMDG